MKSALLACLALSLSSCLSSTPDVCTQTATEPATSVTGPKTASVNQAVAFTIGYPIENGCGKLAGVSEQVQGATRFLGVMVKYDGCNCPQTVTASQTSYTFQTAQAGTYFLKFATTGGFITDTLVVK
ncbi:MAG: hypothetical protein ACRYFX_30880 [Janthinobacterium lividum]